VSSPKTSTVGDINAAYGAGMEVHIKEVHIHVFWDMENCPPPRAAEPARKFVQTLIAEITNAALANFRDIPKDLVHFRMEALFSCDRAMFGRDLPKTCDRYGVILHQVFRKGAHADNH